MEITLGQQYNNVGEKPTVILYTYINRHAGTREKTVKTKQRQSSPPSHMVAIIYCFMGYNYKATTWYLINRVEPWVNSILFCCIVGIPLGYLFTVEN